MFSINRIRGAGLPHCAHVWLQRPCEPVSVLMVGLGHRPPGKAVWQRGWLQETGSGVRAVSSDPPSRTPPGPAQLANPIAAQECVDPDHRAELLHEAPAAALTTGTRFMGRERRAELRPRG